MQRGAVNKRKDDTSKATSTTIVTNMMKDHGLRQNKPVLLMCRTARDPQLPRKNYQEGYQDNSEIPSYQENADQSYFREIGVSAIDEEVLNLAVFGGKLLSTYYSKLAKIGVKPKTKGVLRLQVNII